MKRIINMARLQLINTRSMLWVPFVIAFGALLISLIPLTLVHQTDPGPNYSLGVQAPLWYSLAIGISSLNLLFPFSQAIAITRREFVLGSALSSAIFSLCLAGTLILSGLVEKATGGWGMNAFFFCLPWMWDNGWFGALLLFTVLSVLFFMIGFSFAGVHQRFGKLWLTIGLLVVFFPLFVGIWYTFTSRRWVSVLQWFTDFGPLYTAVATLAFTLCVGAGSYLTLRRTVIR